MNVYVRESELQTLSELKQAGIAAVVIRGLDPNVPMKESGIEWIGQIPAHWEIKYLAYKFDLYYSTPSEQNPMAKALYARNIFSVTRQVTYSKVFPRVQRLKIASRKTPIVFL